MVAGRRVCWEDGAGYNSHAAMLGLVEGMCLRLRVAQMEKLESIFLLLLCMAANGLLLPLRREGPQNACLCVF